MNKKRIGLKHFIIPLLLPTFYLGACAPENEQAKTGHPPGKLLIQDAWARPGPETGNSAVYMTITNNSARDDSLIGIYSAIAARAEVHESFQKENDMMGMRPAGSLPVKQGNTLRLAPGGYHVMLMKLKRSVSAGDTLELTCYFSIHDNLVVQVPVKTGSD